MKTFIIGQFFEDTYPPEAAVWCNSNGAFIESFNGGYIIREVPKPSPEDLEVSKIEHEMAELESKVSALSDRMTIAMMQNDTEEIKQIQMEYAKLTEGANHEEVL